MKRLYLDGDSDRRQLWTAGSSQFCDLAKNWTRANPPTFNEPVFMLIHARDLASQLRQGRLDPKNAAWDIAFRASNQPVAILVFSGAGKPEDFVAEPTNDWTYFVKNCDVVATSTAFASRVHLLAEAWSRNTSVPPSWNTVNYDWLRDAREFVHATALVHGNASCVSAFLQAAEEGPLSGTRLEEAIAHRTLTREVQDAFYATAARCENPWKSWTLLSSMPQIAGK